MKIRIIAPVTTTAFMKDALPFYMANARTDVEISIVNLENGPASIESIYEDVIAAPQVIQRALEAERDGMDAVIIDCMNDPALEACREAVNIPVVGAAQASFMLASILCNRFSVISTALRDSYPIETLIRRYGLTAKYASTRAVEIPVLDLHEKSETLLAAMIAESEKAILTDGAHGLVFGCTLMRDMGPALREGLKKRGLEPVIIEPSGASLRWAEMLVDLRLSQSRVTYPNGKDLILPGHQNLRQEQPASYPGQRSFHASLKIMVPVVQGYRPDNWLDGTFEGYARHALLGTQVSIEAIQKGPETIETHYLKSMCLPEMLRIARKAEKEGATAVIIDCMSDPSLDAAREALQIPVVGPTQTCAFIAASLSHRFSILGTRADMGHKFTNQIIEYGINSKLASVRTTGLSVEEVETNQLGLVKALADAGQQAVEKDGAHFLIPGCTGMIGLAAQVQETLASRGIPVPVIEAPAAAVKMAELLSDLGLTQSKMTYPLPPHKTLHGYPELEY